MKSLMKPLLSLALLLPITTFATVTIDNVELSNDKLAAELELIDVRSDLGTKGLTVKTLESKVAGKEKLAASGAITEWDLVGFKNNLEIQKLNLEVLAREAEKITTDILYFDALLADSPTAVELYKSSLRTQLKIAKLELKALNLQVLHKEKLLGKLSTIATAVTKVKIAVVKGEISKLQVRHRFKLKQIEKLTQSL